jgi:hypothetical protein
MRFIDPNSPPNPLPSDDFSGTFDQHFKEPEGQILNLHANTVSGERFLGAIELERAKG